MRVFVTHYVPKYRNPNSWVPLEHLLLFSRSVTQGDNYLDDFFGEGNKLAKNTESELEWYYVAYSDGLDYEYPDRKEKVDEKIDRGKYYWWPPSRHFIRLPRKVVYSPKKRVWLTPQGYLAYASVNNPDKDQSMVILGVPPKKYRYGYTVDVRELRRQLSKFRAAASAGNLVVDIQIIVKIISFLEAYDSDPVKVFKEVEDALSCLNQREMQIWSYWLKTDCQESWAEVARAVGLSRERVKQIYERSLKKLRKRILWNRVRKLCSLPPATDQAPFTY